MSKSAVKAVVRAGAVLGLLFGLALSPTSSAQVASGAIQGTISDESGAVLPGVAVTLRNQATGLTRETVTDAEGVFRAPLLPLGSWSVSAALQGFATLERKGLTLTIGETLTVELTLKVASAQETVEVTAEAPLIEPTRTQQASTVGSQAVANLPVNGRNFIDFVLTTPGVTRDVRQGDISFAGQRGTLNSLIIDGADNNNTFFGQTLGRTGSGRAPYQFSQDAVQEFQVNRNAYSAEYGRAGGAVINVVTKSGSNQFHGSVFEFYRDKKLNANSWANKIVTPVRPKSPYHFDQFGGSLGGPLVKDKAFFFVSYDGQRNTIPNEISLAQNLGSVAVPSDPASQAGFAAIQSKADSWERRQDQDVFLARVDWQVDARHRLTLRYNHQNFTGQNFENGGATNAEEHTGDSLVRTRTLNASLASVFSSTLFNEFRFQWARDQEPGLANSDAPEATVRQGGRTVLTIGRNFFSPRETTIKRFQFADTLTLIRGSHALKLGVDVNRDQILNFFPGNFSGAYTFSSLASFAGGRPSNAAAGERYVQAFAGPGTSGATTNPDITEFAAFAQDEWRVNKTLTVTLGLRYDVQSFAQPETRNPDPQLAAAGIDTSFLKTDKNNIAPRLGFAWTPNARTVLRGGYGLFYGRTPSIMVGTAHSNNGINVQTVTFTGNLVPTYPNSFAALPTGVTLPRPTIFVFDPDYENPEIHQASLGGEYALSPDLSIGASYLFVAGRQLQRSRDLNVGVPVATAVPVQGGGTVGVQQFPTARPFSNFDRIIRFESTAESTYNGLTLELKKRFTGGLQASLAYTLGKVEDTVPDATAVVPNSGDDAKFTSNPADFEADRAPGNNDQRHRLVLSGYWDLGYWREAQGAAKALLDGWSLSWIASVESGQPYSQVIVNDVNRDGNTRNDIVPGARNSETTPTRYNIDLRVARRVPLTGRVKLELIAEAFNLLNSTNITSQRNGFYTFTSGVLVPQSNFGQDLGAADARIVQLAAKLTF
jgi:outer membrane receptor protein involved in Fe transport